MDATRITEAVSLPSATGSGVLIGEAVREAGLDPELYLAVIPAEMARGGRVGQNGRVYEPESLTVHHTRLVQEAARSFVTGENGHPDAGPEGFDVPARLLDGEVVTEADGSVVARGRMGILNTQSGRDTLVCYRAGMAIGTSLDGLARNTEAVIDAKSRYAAANPGHLGQRVTESKLVALNRYDIVRTPSLGTHFDPPPGPVAEAFRRVIESKCLPEAPVTDATPVTESSPAQVQGEPQENTMPEIKNVADLEREFPQLVAQVRESVKPVATDDAEIAKVREQAEVDRARLADAEKAARVTEAKLAETEKGLAAVTEALAREKTRTAVREALGDSWAAGRKGAATLRAAVVEDFEAGRVATVQEAVAAAERYERIAREAAALGQAETPPAPPAPVVPVTEGRDSTLTNADKPGATQTEKEPFAASFADL